MNASTHGAVRILDAVILHTAATAAILAIAFFAVAAFSAPGGLS